MVCFPSFVPEKLKGLCKYGEDCNFAFNQLEIDVWTEERNGKLDRKRLFETTALKMDPVNNIKHLLQDHGGVYVFLCQVSVLAHTKLITSVISFFLERLLNCYVLIVKFLK